MEKQPEREGIRKWVRCVEVEEIEFCFDADILGGTKARNLRDKKAKELKDSKYLIIKSSSKHICCYSYSVLAIRRSKIINEEFGSE